MNKHGSVKLPSLAELEKQGKLAKIEENSTLMNAQEQAMYLGNTVKCRIGPSKVHGVGVIAMRDIKKGEQLFCALTVKAQWYNVSFANLKKHLKQTHPEVLGLILDRWPNVVNGAPFLSPNYDARLTSFMNHSDTPNFDPHYDVALTDIKAGEEVFEDYRTFPNWDRAYPWLVDNEHPGVV